MVSMCLPVDPGDFRTRLLDALEQLANAADASEIARDATGLRERVAEGRFYVACVGQFKRGKSTLLNALVGETLLPVGVVPVTAVVTVLRYGEKRSARVQFADGPWKAIPTEELLEFVTEARNPENTKGVRAVEVFVPSSLLADGMCLVDTPGIGSVFAGNTQVTREFVPHIDAALLVIGADPPIAGDELQLADEVLRHVEDLVVVLNKADRIGDADRAEASAFAERVLAQRLRRPVGPVLQVSAIEQLNARAPTRDWSALRDRLRALDETSGRALVRAAFERESAVLTRRLSHDLDERRDALTRPIAESVARLAALRSRIAEADVTLHDLSYLFTGEQERLRRDFNALRVAFLARALPEAVAQVAAEVSQSTARGSALRGIALELARAACRTRVESWLTEIEPRAEQMYRAATSRLIANANDFLARLAAAGADGLEQLPPAMAMELGFRTKRRFYRTELFHITSATPWDLLVGWFGGHAAAERRAVQCATKYLERLMESNGARVANDLDERVVESRRRLESEIRSRLKALEVMAERALERARAAHVAGADGVRTELTRVDALRTQLEALRAALSIPGEAT